MATVVAVNGEDEEDPIYENTTPFEVPPIPAHELTKYVQENCSRFVTEFANLPSGLLSPATVAQQVANVNSKKNRYKGYFAYDFNRVILPETPYDTDYINASYIDGYRSKKTYIAAQGPTSYTINDFVRMLWEKKIKQVVMLTSVVEMGVVKCEKYWPDTGQESTHGDIQVLCKGSVTHPNFVERKLQLKKNENTQDLIQFHFTRWPDRGVPEEGSALIEFRNHIRSAKQNTPPVVHCSAGVGRTGAYIAIDHLLDELAVEKVANVFSCIQRLRRERVNMIQTEDQYVFLYKTLAEHNQLGNTSIPNTDYPRVYPSLKEKSASGVSKTDEQYQMFSVVIDEPAQERCSHALQPDNKSKNRDIKIIPSNGTRVYLMKPADGRTDYVNAAIINTPKKNSPLIGAQMPLPDTVVDFWCMIMDYNVTGIVMLDDPNQVPQDSGEYWPPSAGETEMYGSRYEVSSISERSSGNINTHLMSVRDTKSKQASKTIKIFSPKGWAKGKPFPDNKETLYDIYNEVETWREKSKCGYVVVHCMDGVSRTGLYCAISYLCDRIQVEEEVNIYGTVKHLKKIQSRYVSREQYEFCYDSVSVFLEGYADYSNVPLK